ncbi:MAG: apolipoprotein N-acyltransferase [Rhodobacterales bacterium 32-66-7]|nr:MAG: apolipoprotein N-acyltransferase [Rhodobacterales bacterium 32-66-7]
MPTRTDTLPASGQARWLRLATAFGLGAVVAIGQAPWGAWWAALPALSGLIWLLSQRKAGAFWLGLAAGTGHFAVALSWIVEPFLVDATANGWMAPFAVVLMSGGLALFWGAAAGIAARLPQPTLGFVATFTATEALRGVVLTGFPWAMVGHIWIGTPVDQLAAVAGPLGLTLLTLTLAAMPVLWRFAGGIAAVMLLVGVAGLGLWRLAPPLPPGPDGTLRLVQPNAEQALKWDADLAEVFLGRLLSLTAEGTPADLTIWPETAVPYMLEYAPSVAGMITDASGGRPVAVGIQSEAEGRFYNSLRVLEGDGREIASYQKHQLVPFGEYMPLGDLAYRWFGITAFAAQVGNSYSAGPGPRVLDLGEMGKVLPLICYEAVFPRLVNAAPERADWMLQITNDAWFGLWTGPFQHLAQARLRAVEQGLPLIRVANTGVTAVIDARGRVVEELPFGTMAALDTRVPGALPPTPYTWWGDVPVWLLLTFLAALAFRRPSRPAPPTASPPIDGFVTRV